MSNKYRFGDVVPSETICKRLKELSYAVSGGRESILREFDMRVPAEMDRDADLVLAEAANRIAELEKKIESIKSKCDEVANTAVSILNLSDEKIIQDQAAWIADQLIALTEPPDL